MINSNEMGGESVQMKDDKNDIHSLYDKIMQGFNGKAFDTTSEVNEDGNYHVLYAPGYEEMGVAEVVAQCK